MSHLTTTTTAVLATSFGVRVRWGQFVDLFPTAHQTKLTITVPGLPPVTMLLTGGLTPQAPWGDLARQALALFHAGRGITDQRGALAQLHNWLAHPGNLATFNQAWALARECQLARQLVTAHQLWAQHRANWRPDTAPVGPDLLGSRRSSAAATEWAGVRA